MAGLSPGHFVRVLDLAVQSNNYENQFEGNYTQFAFPQVPPMLFGRDVLHENTVTLRVEHEEYVELILQQVDRAAHPFHLHGHKFEVLSVGYPEFDVDCSIMWCQEPWYRPELHSNQLANPRVAILKDTVFIPAGGWAVIRFRADNPGWWLIHCHMHIHLHDGMALVVDEAGERFYENFSTLVQGLSSRCSGAWEGTLHHQWKKNWQRTPVEPSNFDTPFKGDALAVACKCWQDPDMIMDTAARGTYKCTNYYLCHHYTNSLDPPAALAEPKGRRDRSEGRTWRWSLGSGITFLACVTVILIRMLDHRRTRRSENALPNKSQGRLSLATSGTSDTLDELQSWTNDLQVRFTDITVQSTLNGDACLLGVSGVLAPADMTCVMGDNIDSRVALLSVLSGWEPPQPWLITEGTIQAVAEESELVHCKFHFGCQPQQECRSPKSTQSTLYRSMCAFVKEMTASNLTVFETLLFTATLQNPSRESSKKMRTFVDSMMSLFSFTDIAGQQVKDLNAKSACMLSIGCELLFPKVLLALHEPFANVCQNDQKLVLRWLASRARNNGCIVLVSLRNPTSPFTDYFDKVILLQDTGRLFYRGQANQLSKYFADIDKSMPDSSDWNAADWYCKVVSEWMGEPPLPSVPCDSKQLTGSLSLEGQKRTSSKAIGCVRTSQVAAPKIRSSETMAAVSSLQESSADDPPLADKGNPQRQIHYRVSFFTQVWCLLWAEISSQASVRVNFVKFSEVFGLGCIAGCVWWQRNSDESMIGLRETVGLMFLTTAVWTIPPVYQALASVPPLLEQVRVDSKRGLYGVFAIFVAKSLGDILLQLLWPPLWVATAFAFADVGRNLSSQLLMCVIVTLNCLAMQAIAIAVGVVVPAASVNTVVITLISQLFLLVNGFYTDMPPWVKWTSFISPARYTFQALMKLEFSWHDSFYVHPHVGWESRGVPSNYLPAEMTGIIGDLKRRGLHVMSSPQDPTILWEVLFLTAMCCLGRALLLMAMIRVQRPKVVSEQVRHHLQDRLAAIKASTKVNSMEVSCGSTLLSMRGQGAPTSMCVKAEMDKPDDHVLDKPDKLDDDDGDDEDDEFVVTI